MSDWSRTDAYASSVASQPAPRAPSTIGEIWNAEWTRSGLDTIGGVGRPFTESYDELAAAIEKHGGADLGALARRSNVNMGAAVTPDLRIAALNAIADTLPDEARKQIEPLRDVRRRASDKAQEIERNAADVEAGAYGLSGNAAMFLAGVARQAVDPFNLVANIATAPLGGPFKGPVLKVLARQAAAGGAAQLLVEPYVESTRGELGLASGVKEGAINVAQAALGAAGLAGLLRAGKAGFDLARGPRAARPIAEGAPAYEPTFLGFIDHEDAAALDRGEIRPPGERPHSLADVPNVPGFAAPYDIAAGAQARPIRTRLPDEPPRGPSDYAPDYLTPDDVAAFDRGTRVEGVAPLGDGAPGLAGNVDIAAGAQARPDRSRMPDAVVPPSDIMPGFVPADLDRGHPVASVSALGDGAPEFGGSFDIGAGAGARPLRTRAPEAVVPASDIMPGHEAGAFDRGHALETPRSLGDLGETSWRGFEGLSSADLEAAAHLAERDQLVDGAAPPSWDPLVHHAMVDEAAAALEAGRPIDRAKAAEAMRGAGVEPPAVVPIAENALSEGARAVEVKPGQRFGIHNMPPEKMSLFQFLASIGGLHPEDKVARDAAGALHGEALDRGGMTGDLKHILDSNPFVPGMGQLLRKTGLSLERARMAAAEAGYLPTTSTIREFLDMVREEARGNRQYREGFLPEQKRDVAAEKAQREQHRAELASSFDARMAQLEISKLTKADRTRALQIMEKEGQSNPLLAYEQALAEKEATREKLRARRNQEQDLHIPGFDVVDDARAASQVGEHPAAGAGARSGEPDAGRPARGAGEGAGAAGEQGQLGEHTLGDPAVAADFDRLADQHGGDLETTIRLPDGSLQTVSAREHLQLLEEDARAAAELFDCAGGKPEGDT